MCSESGAGSDVGDDGGSKPDLEDLSEAQSLNTVSTGHSVPQLKETAEI